MKLLFLTSGPNTPATRYRVMPFIPKLQEMGYECVVSHCWPPKYDHWFGFRLSQATRQFLRVVDLARACLWGVDVVFLERELLATAGNQLERLFRRVAPRMVLDVDDGIYLLHPQKFRELGSAADLVLAGNHGIASHTRSIGGRSVVIPTCVDTDFYRPVATPRPELQRLVIGWTGTSSNLPMLGALKGPLAELCARIPFHLMVICDRHPAELDITFGEVPLLFRKWSASTELEHLHHFDIGLMPLIDSEWNRLKCGCKAIQYGALGIPAVVSPVGVNCEIVIDGLTGFHANSDDQWTQSLQRLLQSSGLRIAQGTMARQHVLKNYSVESVWPHWFEAVTGAPLPASRREGSHTCVIE